MDLESVGIKKWG